MLRFIFFILCPIFFIACFDEQSEKSSYQSTTSTSTSNINIETSTKDESQTTPQKTSDPQALYARCASCHGKDGKSVAPGSVGNVLIASLNKQQVRESLKGFRARTLSKGGNSVIMYMQTKNLSDADIEALAEYIDAF